MKHYAELKVHVFLFDGSSKLNDIIPVCNRAECIVTVREWDMAPFTLSCYELLCNTWNL